MKKEKAAENLEKQGRGLTIFLKILGVILLLLNLLLLDQEFVPWGEDWEEIKLVFFDEDTTGMTDKELWAIAKDTLVEEGDVPIKSGFLCWARVLFAWNEPKANEAERAAKIRQDQKNLYHDWSEEEIRGTLLRQARKNAETIMTTINEFLSENGFKTDSLVTVHIYFYDKEVRLQYWDDDSREDIFSEDEVEKLKKSLLEAISSSKEAAAQAYILGEKCTAAAFKFKSNNVANNGTEFPHVDENGHFDTEQTWGYGWSEAHNAGWLIQYVDEVMLEDSVRQDNE